MNQPVTMAHRHAIPWAHAGSPRQRSARAAQVRVLNVAPAAPRQGAGRCARGGCRAMVKAFRVSPSRTSASCAVWSSIPTTETVRGALQSKIARSDMGPPPLLVQGPAPASSANATGKGIPGRMTHSGSSRGGDMTRVCNKTEASDGLHAPVPLKEIPCHLVSSSSAPVPDRVRGGPPKRLRRPRGSRR